VQAIGLSDFSSYAQLLADKFSYTNTFFHREPNLDLSKQHPEKYEKYDFILASGVLEHIAPPIERALEEAFKLLKPSGFLVVTVPSSLDEHTVEHFPDLHRYTVLRIAGHNVLINRTRKGRVEIRTDLIFHEGPGSTLEMRLFSRKDLVRKLQSVGFTEVDFLDSNSLSESGIVFDGPWSRPFVARKKKFCPLPIPLETIGPENFRAVLTQHKGRLSALEIQLKAAARSRWLKLGRFLGLGPKIPGFWD
jgi:SAM-dependent methyltransferase